MKKNARRKKISTLFFICFAFDKKFLSCSLSSLPQKRTRVSPDILEPQPQASVSKVSHEIKVGPKFQKFFKHGVKLFLKRRKKYLEEIYKK